MMEVRDMTLRLPVLLPRAMTTWRLSVRDAHKLGNWLTG